MFQFFGVCCKSLFLIQTPTSASAQVEEAKESFATSQLQEEILGCNRENREGMRTLSLRRVGQGAQKVKHEGETCRRLQGTMKSGVCRSQRWTR